MTDVPQWFVTGTYACLLAIFVLIVVWLSMKIVGAEIHHFKEALGLEFSDLLSAKWTMASANLSGVLLVCLFGFIVMVATTGQKVLGIALASILGPKLTGELVQYTNYPVFFYVVALLLIVSLLCVVVNNQRLAVTVLDERSLDRPRPPLVPRSEIPQVISDRDSVSPPKH